MDDTVVRQAPSFRAKKLHSTACIVLTTHYAWTQHFLKPRSRLPSPKLNKQARTDTFPCVHQDENVLLLQTGVCLSLLVGARVMQNHNHENHIVSRQHVASLHEAVRS